MRCVLAFVLLASVCQGQDQVPLPAKYPAKVYKMTDAQFFRWATGYNKAQLDDWKQRAAIGSEYLYGTESVTTMDFSGNHYGGSYYGSASRRSINYPRRWRNPDYVSPGPLVIINPYVRPR